MNAYTDAMRRFFDFSSRSSRSQYWLYVLFYIILAFAAMAIDAAVLRSPGGSGILSVVVSLVHVIPGLAVSVRRLHDIDKSGWWLLLAFIPLVGAIVLLVWMCKAGTPGSNRFGNQPTPAGTLAAAV